MIEIKDYEADEQTNEVDTDEDMSGISEDEEVVQEEPKTGVVMTPNNGPLNLRSNPDKKSVALTSIPSGTKIQYAEFSDEWAIVKYGHFEGYCMKKFIK